MWGSFTMVNEIDEPLECKIPAFTLECLREDDIDTDPILGIQFTLKIIIYTFRYLFKRKRKISNIKYKMQKAFSMK